jgi:hypothetical protein
VGLGLGGHLVERIGVERMVAGTTELAAGHGFHGEILLEKKLANPHGRGRGAVLRAPRAARHTQ